MSGMLIQLAAATAAKGTHLPISGGAVCEHTENIYIGLRRVKENSYVVHHVSFCIVVGYASRLKEETLFFRKECRACRREDENGRAKEGSKGK